MLSLLCGVGHDILEKRELCLSNFVLFSCICTHNLRKDKGKLLWDFHCEEKHTISKARILYTGICNIKIILFVVLISLVGRIWTIVISLFVKPLFKTLKNTLEVELVRLTCLH